MCQEFNSLRWQLTGRSFGSGFFYGVSNHVEVHKSHLNRVFFDPENEYKAVLSARYAEKQPVFSRFGAVNTVGDTIVFLGGVWKGIERESKAIRSIIESVSKAF